MAGATFVGVTDDSFAIEADVTTKESHELSSTPTQKPIDSGGVVADHIQKDQPRLRMEVEISDTPVALLNNHSRGVTRDLKQVAKVERTIRDADGNVTGKDIVILEGYVMSGPLERRKDIHEELTRAWDERILVNVQTTLKLYENMAFTTVSNVIQRGSKMVCNIDLVQLKFATTQTVAALPPLPKKPTVKADKDAGRKPTTNPEPVTAQSLLNSFGLGDFLFGRKAPE